MRFPSPSQSSARSISRLPRILLLSGAVLAMFAVPPAASSAYLTVNGGAQIETLPYGQEVLLLTTNGIAQIGSAFTTEPIVFDDRYRFHTVFKFVFSQPGGIGAADGITFTIQTQGANALGGGGGALGVSGITPSVGINFVTYQNYWDISDNTVGVITNGSYEGVDQHSPYGVVGCYSPTGIYGCMGNGDLWSVWIDYDGETLSVALADNSTVRPPNLIEYPIDLFSILGGKPAYVGFTGATGNGVEYHRVASWVFLPDPKR
jgi:hypothetical protein